MAEAVIEKTDKQVEESIRRISHATASMAEAIDDGVNVIRIAVKRSGDLAEELMEDTSQRVKRHPVETLVGVLTIGFVSGALIGWMIGRK